MHAILEKYRRLPAPVYFLTLAALINAAGSFVRVFLTMILTDKLGFSTDLAGFVVMIAIALYVPGSLLGGKLADSAGRKITFLLFSALSAAAYAATACLRGEEKAIPLILAAVLFTSAAAPAATAMLMDLTDAKSRKTAFSLYYIGGNLGFSLGLLAAGFLYQRHYHLLFWSNALAILIPMTLIAILVGETLSSPHEPGSVPTHERPFNAGTARLFFKDPYLAGCAAAGILYSLVYSQASFSLPLLLTDLFRSRGAAYYGYLMSANGITVILLTPLLSAVTSRLRSISNLSLAGLLFACGFGMILFSRAMPLFLLSTLVWTAGEILNAVNLNVFLAEHAPASHRSRFYALYNSIAGAGQSLGPWLCGLFLLRFALAWVWPIAFALAFSGAALLHALSMREQGGLRENKQVRV